MASSPSTARSTLEAFLAHDGVPVGGIAVGVMLGTYALLDLGPSVPLLVLGFCGTLVIYQLDRVLAFSPEDQVNRPARRRWMWKHRAYVWSTVALGLGGGGVVLPLLRPATLWWAGGLGMLGLLHVLPMLGRGRRLKAFGFVKPLAISGAWAFGSLMPLVLERIGLEPVVIDRAAHPRFAIGESSTPTANMILRDLADRYDLPRLRPLAKYGPWQEAHPEIVAGRKRGFSCFRHQPGKPFVPDPQHANELLVAASSDPYYSDTHWLRADVDTFLAGEVRATGIPLLERTEVTAIERNDRWHVIAQRDGEAVRCTANFLVDATGTAGVVPRALGIADRGNELTTRSRALYGHFAGVPLWQKEIKHRGGHDAIFCRCHDVRAASSQSP